MTRQITTAASFPCKPVAEVRYRAVCVCGRVTWWTCANTPAGPVTTADCDCEEKR